MELKVWVEGIQRIVCGVTVNTTCQDVVFALAHATGKVGRFTLIERWRNNERLLAPTENPLKLLLKWGEYANDVQFILQRSEQTKRPAPATTADEKGHSQQFGSTNATKKQPLASNVNDSDLNLQQPMQQQQSIHAATEFMPLNRCKELRKSFGSSESSKPIENVGIVKGVPQRTSAATSSQPSPTSLQKSAKHEKTPSNLSLPSSTSTSETLANYFETNSTNEINLAEVRNALDRRTSPPTTQMNYSPHQTESNNNISNSSENLIDAFNGNTSSSNISNNNNNNAKYQAISNNVSPDLYKNTPLISSNGALVPPPYRDPPPPRNSPMQLQLQQQTQAKLMEFSTGVGGGSNFNKKTDGACSNPFLSDMGDADFNDNFFEAAQYKDLIQLIKFQREKITSQQTELTKYDAEIVYLENKERDQAQELEAISREITKADQIFRQGTEQLQTLQYVEEENELVKQQEKTLKSEITLLRSKLANCETELLQCKNKIRILMDDIQVEQRAISNRQKDNRQNVERDFLIEMERIQTEIDQAIHNTDSSSKATDNLKKEINMIENAIAEKKRQVEQLVNEMKEVNLQSLAVTPSDEIRNLLEGSNKPGSSRRIIGSPRQLENAVPTSKNPHGVWV